MSLEKKGIDASCIVIFGATGDLTHRKLLPALYYLEHRNLLGETFRIICSARRDKDDDAFRKEAADSIGRFSRLKAGPEVMEKLLSRIHYHRLEFDNLEHYRRLASILKGKKGIIFYLATPPMFFDIIVGNLASVNLAGKNAKFGSNKVAFEKPFGKDLESAKKLNSGISKIFHERQIYRIDHYLAKELVQNLIVMRFANSIFEPLWNAKYIDHVQITLAETLGIEGRGAYYDANGTLKDVVQNHLMQLLCLTAMECPKSLEADDIRDEKVKVLKSVANISNIRSQSVKGQYTSGVQHGKKAIAYRSEEGVRKNSTTSTYFALKLHINSSKWKNVPFYIRTGKRLSEKATEIVIQYKKPLSALFSAKSHSLRENRLVVRVQPDEGIILKFNVKVPGSKILIDEVSMDFCHECRFGTNTIEAYERLLYDMMHSDQTLFARWDEVENSWKLVDRLRDAWHDVQPCFYSPGSWGPKEADRLIEKDGRKWSMPQKPAYTQLEK